MKKKAVYLALLCAITASLLGAANSVQAAEIWSCKWKNLESECGVATLNYDSHSFIDTKHNCRCYVTAKPGWQPYLKVHYEVAVAIPGDMSGAGFAWREQTNYIYDYKYETSTIKSDESDWYENVYARRCYFDEVPVPLGAVADITICYKPCKYTVRFYNHPDDVNRNNCIKTIYNVEPGTELTALDYPGKAADTAPYRAPTREGYHYVWTGQWMTNRTKTSSSAQIQSIGQVNSDVYLFAVQKSEINLYDVSFWLDEEGISIINKTVEHFTPTADIYKGTPLKDHEDEAKLWKFVGWSAHPREDGANYPELAKNAAKIYKTDELPPYVTASVVYYPHWEEVPRGGNIYVYPNYYDLARIRNNLPAPYDIAVTGLRASGTWEYPEYPSQDDLIALFADHWSALIPYQYVQYIKSHNDNTYDEYIAYRSIDWDKVVWYESKYGDLFAAPHFSIISESTIYEIGRSTPDTDKSHRTSIGYIISGARAAKLICDDMNSDAAVVWDDFLMGVYEQFANNSDISIGYDQALPIYDDTKAWYENAEATVASLNTDELAEVYRNSLETRQMLIDTHNKINKIWADIKSWALLQNDTRTPDWVLYYLKGYMTVEQRLKCDGNIQDGKFMRPFFKSMPDKYPWRFIIR